MFRFRRSGDASGSEGVRSTKLKNVAVGDPVDPTTVEFSSSFLLDVPLKKLKGNWIVVVKPAQLADAQNQETQNAGVDQSVISTRNMQGEDSPVSKEKKPSTESVNGSESETASGKEKKPSTESANGSESESESGREKKPSTESVNRSESEIASVQEKKPSTESVNEPESETISGEEKKPSTESVNVPESETASESNEKSLPAEENTSEKEIESEIEKEEISFSEIESKPILKRDVRDIFSIQVLQQEDATGNRCSVVETSRNLTEVMTLHRSISECTIGLMQHPLFCDTASASRKSSGDMNENLANLLELSPLDSVRVTGKLLSGLLDTATSQHPAPQA